MHILEKGEGKGAAFFSRKGEKACLLPHARRHVERGMISKGNESKNRIKASLTKENWARRDANNVSKREKQHRLDCTQGMVGFTGNRFGDSA